MKHCSHCGSTNVRRSGIHGSDVRSHPFHSPYRCLDCETRFWVVSRRTRVGAAAGGTVALALAAVLLGPMLVRHQQLPVRDTRPSSNLQMPRSTATESVERRTVDDIVKGQSDVLTQRFEQAR